MALQVRRTAPTTVRTITTLVALFALVAQPMYGLVASQVANAVTVDGSVISDIQTYDEFKSALSNHSYTHINLAKGVTINVPVNESLILARNGVRIDGNDSTIQKPINLSNGWRNGGTEDAYLFKVSKARNIEINSLRMRGGDAGMLISSSQVTLKGNMHVDGHEFGGIEVSRTNSATGAEPAALTLQGALWNETGSEKSARPSVWAIDGQGSVDSTALHQTLHKATHINTDQTQYYLRQANTGTVATNVNTGETYTSLQGAIDEAQANQTVRLEVDTAIDSALRRIKANTIIDGNNLSVTAAYAGAMNGTGGVTNTAVAIARSNVTVKNLTINATHESNPVHGVVVDADAGAPGLIGVALENVKINGATAGVLLSDRAEVAINGIHTTGSIWGGIGVHRSSTLNISGANSHSELVVDGVEKPHIYTNNRADATINVGKAYFVYNSTGAEDHYRLGNAVPIIESVTPSEGSSIRGGSQRIDINIANPDVVKGGWLQLNKEVEVGRPSNSDYIRYQIQEDEGGWHAIVDTTNLENGVKYLFKVEVHHKYGHDSANNKPWGYYGNNSAWQYPSYHFVVDNSPRTTVNIVDGNDGRSFSGETSGEGVPSQVKLNFYALDDNGSLIQPVLLQRQADITDNAWEYTIADEDLSIFEVGKRYRLIARLDNNTSKFVNFTFSYVDQTETEDPETPVDGTPEDTTDNAPDNALDNILEDDTLDTVETAELVRTPTAGGGTNLGNAPSNFAVFTLPGETATDDQDDDTAVLGAQTERNTTGPAEIAAAVPTEGGWKIFGLMWYWWLLIIAAVAGAMWAIAARRRSQDDAAL